MFVGDMNDKPLRLELVSHSFDSLQVVTELRLDIAFGEFVVLVGPSGGHTGEETAQQAI